MISTKDNSKYNEIKTSYCESQISLAKNYYIFQLSCTINKNNIFLQKWIEKQVAYENK